MAEKQLKIIENGDSDVPEYELEIEQSTPNTEPEKSDYELTEEESLLFRRVVTSVILSYLS